MSIIFLYISTNIDIFGENILMIKIQTTIDNKNGNVEVEMLLEITNTDSNIPLYVTKD